MSDDTRPAEPSSRVSKMSADIVKARLPRLQQVVEFEDTFPLWNVKFYPYGHPEDDPVFAVIGDVNTIVYKLVGGAEGNLERLCWFQDEGDVNLFSFDWSFDSETGEPLLCVAGEGENVIKLLGVTSGKVARTLVGHGHKINDLKTSPINASVIASASDDNSIRIWHLHPNIAHQPCAAVLSGDGGHETGVISLAFHANGRYLLSGGYDTRLCLWVLPEYPSSKDAAYGNAGGGANIIHFPHFCTTALHFHQIDALTFHGDHILSKSYDPEKDSPDHNCILLWRITGFNSNKPIPPLTAAPANMPRGIHTTVSAWSDTSQGSGGFQVLMAFECPGVKADFMRFGLSPVIDLSEPFTTANPQLTTPSTILVIGGHIYDKEKPITSKPKGKEGSSTSTSKSNSHWRIPTQIHLWDLGLLADGIEGQGLVETVSPRGIGLRVERNIKPGSSKGTGTSSSPMIKPRASTFGSNLEVGAFNTRSSSAFSSSRLSSARTPESDMIDTTIITSDDNSKQAATDLASPISPMWGPYTPQKAHKVIQAGQGLKIPDFTPRTMAWSPDGKVGIVVGDTPASLWILGRD